MAELKKAQQQFKAVARRQKQEQTGGTEQFLFKRLEQFCVPQRRNNDEYMELVRSCLFGGKGFE